MAGGLSGPADRASAEASNVLVDVSVDVDVGVDLDGDGDVEVGAPALTLEATTPACSLSNRGHG
jgi:hypothetical protein